MYSTSIALAFTVNGGVHADNHLSPASSHESISSLSTASTSGSNNQQNKEANAANNPSVSVTGVGGLLQEQLGSTPSASSLNVMVTPLPSVSSLRVSAQSAIATDAGNGIGAGVQAGAGFSAEAGGSGSSGQSAGLSIAESMRRERERNPPPLPSFRKPVLPPPPPPTPATGFDQADQLITATATGREHAFQVKDFFVTQKCAFCSSILYGQQRQGLACNSAPLCCSIIDYCNIIDSNRLAILYSY